MHKQVLKKPDGRDLHLYSRRPIPAGLAAPSPRSEPSGANPHLRWHPLRGEWVAYASHRQDRTFLPPKEYNPLLPMVNPKVPTELPAGDYDIAVFENLFPSLAPDAHAPPTLSIPTRAGTGVCEVVVFTQDPQASLGSLPLSQIELLLSVWAERYREIGARPEIEYVMPFENRGVEVGVTLHHPHGQIYSYPFIPPVPRRELELNREHFSRTGHSLLEDHVQAELKDETRLLYAGPHAVAFVPACARYTYEAWITTRARRASLADLNEAERADFARALKTTLLKYDGLWKRPFPYLMVIHQAPTDGEARPEGHFHIEFSPPYRTPDRLKYLAGTELGAGMFANDTLPEAKALELRAVEVSLD